MHSISSCRRLTKQFSVCLLHSNTTIECLCGTPSSAALVNLSVSIARVAKLRGVKGVGVPVHIDSKAGHQLSRVVTTTVGFSPFGFR